VVQDCLSVAGVLFRNVLVRVRDLPDPVIDVPDWAIASGERVAIMGPSGAGKTTLLNVLTGLERPGSGAVLWDGLDIASLSEAKRDSWRARQVGIVMQDFNLFPGLSALDNVLLPQQLRSLRLRPIAWQRARNLLDRVGIERHDQPVDTMSRGEMQRVAVARALQAEPVILVADEPTASLDEASARSVADLLVELSAAAGATLVVVTHDESLAQAMDRVVRLEAGRILSAEGCAA
jgi:putative ABC transport system ATP-binding protein